MSPLPVSSTKSSDPSPIGFLQELKLWQFQSVFQLVFPLYFCQHNPPLTLMQKGVVIFGEIVGSKRTPATLGTGFPSKNIPDLVSISFHWRIWQSLQSSVLTSMMYSSSHWEKEQQNYFEFFVCFCTWWWWLWVFFSFCLFLDVWSFSIYFTQFWHICVSKTSFYWLRLTSGYLVQVALSRGSWSSHLEGPQVGLFPLDLQMPIRILQTSDWNGNVSLVTISSYGQIHWFESMFFSHF